MTIDIMQSLLKQDAPHIRMLYALAANPPRLTVIEGGEDSSRRIHAFAYAMRLLCSNKGEVCGVCEACKSCKPYVTVHTEYSAIDKKHRQEYGTYITFGDIHYMHGGFGVYSKQIARVKEIIADVPRFTKHIVIIEEFQSIHSIKEIGNALLKVMEESSNAYFIITVPERNSLIQTILSRAYILTLPFVTFTTATTQTIWVDALVEFFSTGKGWFSKSGSKTIECSQKDATECVVACKIALCECISQQYRSPLAKALHKHILHATNKKTHTTKKSYMEHIQQISIYLEETEQYLQNSTSTMLVLDNLAMKIYTLV